MPKLESSKKSKKNKEKKKKEKKKGIVLKKRNKREKRKKITLKKARSSRKKLTKIPKPLEKKKKVKEISFSLIKPQKNLLISPVSNHDWEAWQTFNPGVILLEDKVHFLYRAIGKDGISRFGYANSNDGFLINERLPYPVYEHSLFGPGFTYYSFASGGSFGGAEDARPVRVEKEDVIYMTYTACDQGLRMALTSIKVKDFLKKNWQWEHPVLISKPGEIHKNWTIFPEKINGKYAILHSLSPRVLIDFRESMEFQEGEYISSFYDGKNENGGWEAKIRGIGAPPIKTKDGWLLFYHGIDKLDPGKYKVGVMLLDLIKPEKILFRLPKPILEPDEIFQNDGFKPGVVYVSGAVVKNSQLLIYYGAADSYVCVAWADFNEFMKDISREIKPKMRYEFLKQ